MQIIIKNETGLGKQTGGEHKEQVVESLTGLGLYYLRIGGQG